MKLHMHLHTQSLIKLINDEKLTKVCEVGIWKAHNLKSVLHECPGIREYYGVDQFKYLGPGFGRQSNKTPENWDEMYLYTCKLSMYFPCLKVFRLTSLQAAGLFSKRYFDLVFIDADHRYPAVLEDTEAWLPLVKKGGILSGHDYSPTSHHRGVKKAVDEIFSEAGVQILPGEVWVKRC